MEELLTILHNRPITETTIKSHVTTFKKIEPLLHGVSISMLNYDDILSILSSPLVTSLSLSYKRKIISLFIVYFDALKHTSVVTKLRELLKSLSVDIVDERVEKFTTKDTDQYTDILNYIYSPEVIADPRKFITNFIVFFLNTRNLDLLVKIIYHTTPMTDDTINYLVVYPAHIEYVRNTYKTKKNYNSKINKITDPIFINAVKQQLHGLPQSNGFLLSNNPNSLGTLVKNQLYNGMNETNYLQNNVSYFKNDVNRLFQIQNNRGTNIGTLLSSYNKDYNPSLLV